MGEEAFVSSIFTVRVLNTYLILSGDLKYEFNLLTENNRAYKHFILGMMSYP